MRTSVRDVAEAAGVSVGTVSNVLNNPERVADETARRVREAIAELGFVRNDAARQLRAGRSRSIGLVVLEASNPFFADVARGAEARADADGLIVLTANSDDDEAREKANLAMFEQQRVLGVALSPLSDDPGQIRRLQEHGIHVVLIERTATDQLVSSVSVDNIAGGQLAVEHLVATGRRRIAFVGGPISIKQVSDRLAGARRAIAGTSGATVQVIATKTLTVLEGRAAGEAIVAMDPTERPDAVFAANDLLAIGVMQAVRAAGISIPDEVALIGYDDIDFASSTEIPLSSIRQPSRQLGHTAVDLLLERVASPESPAQHIVFDPELVIRGSTVPE